MIAGYAYARSKAEAEARAQDLRAVGAERVWIDHPGSQRAERADLFGIGQRAGCTLILLRRADLGTGREPERFEAMADRMGVTIDLREPEKPSRAKPGPVAVFNPGFEQERRIRHYWHGPFKAATALAVASEVMGIKVTRNMLNKRIGTRSKPLTWINKER